MNIRFIVEYDGTRYEGWQRQVRTEETIQGKLEKAILKVMGEKVQVLGAGRTDAGVHSRGQTANVRLKDEIAPEVFEDRVNRELPNDIGIHSAREAGDRFHARFSAKDKTYVYRIRIGSHKQVFERRFIWQYGEKLDVDAMKKAASLLTGEHDFKSFTSNRKTKKSTVRTISSIDLTVKNDVLSIAYTGDGFLTGMIRILTGTLVEVGEGKKKPEDIPGILQKQDRKFAGFTAPPEGLTLEKVRY